MISFPKAYIAYLVEFHASRDYFECHELLEEYWKENPGDRFADTWVGLIQLAVGLYHERRGNVRGAVKMLMQADRRLSAAPLDELGLGKNSLQMQLSARLIYLQAEDVTPYTDINLQIVNEDVILLCKQMCDQRGLIWGATSPLDDDAIIHRHSKRDRSDVIAARLAAYEVKKRERSGMID
ncbi:hypothetical protein BK120_02005 [Paenibacillus sp. FSL A5-0031]|uniref:DUF309 domain-containing protein n=1 Tax=Paenibacillus sp. FSL A5-0031 TaxID=1920420 RepID=UPI00096F9696|nr:DUF309 domain-containing protein [Paenibacillus sp. FSL A5-0031]OME88110.1 hypothetical protein BK120_02005 [Paenibacillus sp. FSL A5-0031]